jgi:hypothetical protein
VSCCLLSQFLVIVMLHSNVLLPCRLVFSACVVGISSFAQIEKIRMNETLKELMSIKVNDMKDADKEKYFEKL